jgi:hypothetical protein
MALNRRFSAILSISLSIAACAPGKPAKHVAEQSLSSIGCKTSQSEIWSAFQSLVDEQIQFPSATQLRNALLQSDVAEQFEAKAFARYVDAFIEYYQVTIGGIESSMAPMDQSAWKKALAEMEIGIRVTEVHSALHDKVQAALNKLESAESDLNGSCSQPDPAQPPPIKEAGTIWERLRSENPEVAGILRTFATAYQSCDVLHLPAMSAATASAQGISIVGDHPAGGKKREISNRALLNSTHYYIHNQRLAKNTCFEVRNSPMIYDFGGKPNTVAAVPNELNMFKDGGSGTSVLGIDCSAFVFSALALAGLKMDPDPKKVLKADLVHGIGSSAYKEPQSNGLRCLDKIKVTKTVSIAPGDIIAINGHVNIVDSTGPDPFGLARAAGAADCTSAKLTSSGFDFVIAQSSPSKGGIGINRYRAKDYLNESSTYRTGLTAYAVAACKAKFGGNATVDSPNLSVIRHRRTPECMAPRLVSRNMDCVDSCN